MSKITGTGMMKIGGEMRPFQIDSHRQKEMFADTYGIDIDDYYTTLAGNVSKLFVYDASFIKFRQLTLGYSLPARMFGEKIQGATLSLVGRNLFTLMKKTDNIDPEASYSGYTQGLELGGVPPVRSYGLNLNVKF
jgi:hypothetical protein